MPEWLFTNEVLLEREQHKFPQAETHPAARIDRAVPDRLRHDDHADRGAGKHHRITAFAH